MIYELYYMIRVLNIKNKIYKSPHYRYLKWQRDSPARDVFFLGESMEDIQFTREREEVFIDGANGCEGINMVSLLSYTCGPPTIFWSSYWSESIGRWVFDAK